LLEDRLASQQPLTLRELTGPGWYTSSRGKTVYHYGGPFVVYLLECFGGERFLELYKSVRRDRFIHVSEAILETGWGDLEADFWRWYSSKTSRFMSIR
jgi:hypothetical protein